MAWSSLGQKVVVRKYPKYIISVWRQRVLLLLLYGHLQFLSWTVTGAVEGPGCRWRGDWEEETGEGEARREGLSWASVAW